MESAQSYPRVKCNVTEDMFLAQSSMTSHSYGRYVTIARHIPHLLQLSKAKGESKQQDTGTAVIISSYNHS